MTVARIVHFVAGLLVLTSLMLSQLSHWWLLLGAFVGLNLLQSSFTRWCLMAQLLRRAGVHDEEPGAPAV
jgi:hypothetical protein